MARCATRVIAPVRHMNSTAHIACLPRHKQARRSMHQMCVIALDPWAPSQLDPDPRRPGRGHIRTAVRITNGHLRAQAVRFVASRPAITASAISVGDKVRLAVCHRQHYIQQRSRLFDLVTLAVLRPDLMPSLRCSYLASSRSATSMRRGTCRTSVSRS